MLDTNSNAIELVKGFLDGDTKVTGREDFKNLDKDMLSQALNLIVNNPNLSPIKTKYYIENAWKFTYYVKPPTMEEFLTPEWMGAGVVVYPHVKKALCEYMGPTSNYRALYLAPHIGWGKSFMAVYVVIYILVHLYYMKNPQGFFDVPVTQPLAAVLGSFTLRKAKQLLVKPFLNFLQNSPKFLRIKQEERLKLTKQKEIDAGTNRIVWTTASSMDSCIQFANDTHIIEMSDPSALLGLTIIVGVLSELSFFLERGVSPEQIMRFKNDLEGRIFSRVGKRYFTSIILDSSPNSFDSPIDQFIFGGEAYKDPTNYVVTGKHWETFPSPKTYPIWYKTRETFPVFRGSKGKPARIITEEEVPSFAKEDVFNVPIDAKNIFEDSVTKAVKDLGGYPSESGDKLISNFDYIEEMFQPHIKNLYDGIYAPANQNPEKLIWDQIKDIFFIKIDNKNYQFYRAPYAKRWIHIDQAENGDMASIGVVHPEIEKSGRKIIVTDFVLPILPGKEGINLDAVSAFIYDLRDEGKMPIEKVTFDIFASPPTIQRFKRSGFNCAKFSVERDKKIYETYVSWMKNGRIKAGKNIYLKNNLKSIYEATTKTGYKKIDHTIGKVVYKDSGVWETSSMGINAKDVSDSHCGAAYQCIQESGIPSYQWVEQSELIEEDSFEYALRQMKKNFHLV
jgi:hypothetical protein